MSTRCQVKIVTAGVQSSKNEFTLYHHCDGYPSAMVPLIAAAYAPDWKHGRNGKVAAFVIAEDENGYELEQGHALHGNIEWYYILEVKSETHVGAIPEWFLRVYAVPYGALAMPDMRLVFKGPIAEAVKRAETMEEDAAEKESF
jgi:hypothetical protein